MARLTVTVRRAYASPMQGQQRDASGPSPPDPISARHLQEAIVGSTLMYGTEITWRGQRSMEEEKKKIEAEAAAATVAHEAHPSTTWTDGSRLEYIGGAFCYFSDDRTPAAPHI